jgi:hypothetical protein
MQESGGMGPHLRTDWTVSVTLLSRRGSDSEQDALENHGNAWAAILEELEVLIRDGSGQVAFSRMESGTPKLDCEPGRSKSTTDVWTEIRFSTG